MSVEEHMIEFRSASVRLQKAAKQAAKDAKKSKTAVHKQNKKDAGREQR